MLKIEYLWIVVQGPIMHSISQNGSVLSPLQQAGEIEILLFHCLFHCKLPVIKFSEFALLCINKQIIETLP